MKRIAGAMAAAMPFVRNAAANAIGDRKRQIFFSSPDLNKYSDSVIKKVRVISSIPIFDDHINAQDERITNPAATAALREYSLLAKRYVRSTRPMPDRAERSRTENSFVPKNFKKPADIHIYRGGLSCQAAPRQWRVIQSPVFSIERETLP